MRVRRACSRGLHRHYQEREARSARATLATPCEPSGSLRGSSRVLPHAGRQRADVVALRALQDLVPVFAVRRRIAAEADVGMALGDDLELLGEIGPSKVRIDRSDDNACGGKLGFLVMASSVVGVWMETRNMPRHTAGCRSGLERPRRWRRGSTDCASWPAGRHDSPRSAALRIPSFSEWTRRSGTPTVSARRADQLESRSEHRAIRA
jgi:hypothetical protein